ncbi:hypothetical protein HMI54_011906, partial [Coelomomyces lativittatus]
MSHKASSTGLRWDDWRCELAKNMMPRFIFPGLSCSFYPMFTFFNAIGHGFTKLKKKKDVIQKESTCKRKCPDCDDWHDCSSRSLILDPSSPSRLLHHENVKVDCSSNNPPPSTSPTLGTEHPLPPSDSLCPTDAFSAKSSLGLSHPPLSFHESLHVHCNSNKLPPATRPTVTKKHPLQNRDSLYSTNTSSSNGSIGFSNSCPLGFSSSLRGSDATSHASLHNSQNTEYPSHQRPLLDDLYAHVNAIHPISTDPSSRPSIYPSSYPSDVPHSNLVWAPTHPVFPIQNSSFTTTSMPFSESIPASQLYSTFLSA